jgi:predicted transcriptional regulator
MKRKNPETSNEAYRSLDPMKINETHGRILDGLKSIGSGTYEDLANFLSLENQRVWRRLSELHRGGLIHRTGERKIMKSGRQGFVWVPGSATEPVKKKERVLKGKTVVDFSKSILKQAKLNQQNQERLF